MMGIVASQADVILSGFNTEIIIYFVGLFTMFGIFHIIGYLAIFWRDKTDRLTVSICLTYMNFVLAIYLASTFFNEPKILIPIILTAFPWAISIIPFKYAMRKLHASSWKIVKILK